jgi:DNA sulfur modification protein DndD
MYLSSLSLHNWRSYSDVKFDFKSSTARRPLVLVGAMNGHGKTSFLLGLYLGLFGKFGLRYAEGFDAFQEDNAPYYRLAIQKFRRHQAPAEEPTSIDITFSPSAGELDESEVRIVRRWHFTSDARPRQGDSFETVALYVNGKPQKLITGLEAAHDRIERLLFPAHVMPAFFFDGEQAQTLITQSGEAGIKKAVEVMFGTKIVTELREQMRQFLAAAHSKAGGKKAVSTQQRELSRKSEEREALESEIRAIADEIAALERRKAELDSSQRQLRERLARLGGERRNEIESLHAEIDAAQRARLDAEKALTDKARQLGVALALSRLHESLVNRLESEALLEDQEGRQHTVSERRNAVLQAAMPEPAEDDPLLGHLAPHIRTKVRERFSKALEHIYHPPPDGVASAYLLGHAKGELRRRLLELARRAASQSAPDLRAASRWLREARDTLDELTAKRQRIGNVPQEARDTSDKLGEVQQQIAAASHSIGSKERELESKRARLKDLSAEIGRLQEQIASLEPEQRRIAVAERVFRSLDAIVEQLRPITLDRLQRLVTKHFLAIADQRFAKGEIVFPQGGAPVLRRQDQPDALIEMMGGFERRSFGIAFSLALAEITKRRVPLVIDTPLGNADTQYRSRLLRAITGVQLDQIVILTHDAEVNGALFEEVEKQLAQTFLVEYDRRQQQSMVHEGSYFEGVGR